MNTVIYIAGHRGMVGSAIKRHLEKLGYSNILVRTSSELDLRNQSQVQSFFASERPDIVIDAAARVGGILANSQYPYQFLMENMLIQNNLLTASLEQDCKKFIFLGSSCIYPKFAAQPLKEEYLMTSSLEETNEWYAIAKISGVKACEAIRKQYGKDYISLMPTNLYGPYDNFDLKTSHVLPALIRKFHEAKVTGEPVKLWGTGAPLREFLYVEDLAKAVVFMMEHQTKDNLYNVGFGEDLSIKDLALMVQEIIGHSGEIVWDDSKPDGTPRKLMDSSKIMNLGWKPEVGLKEGINRTYQWFLEHQDSFKQIQL